MMKVSARNMQKYLRAYNFMFEKLKHCEAQADDDSLFASLQ